jgi:hypothetical protein
MEEAEGTAAPASALATDTAVPTPITKSAEPSKPPSPIPVPKPSEMELEIAPPVEQLDEALNPEGLDTVPGLDEPLDVPEVLDESFAPPVEGFDTTAALDDGLAGVVEGLNPDDLSTVDLSQLPTDGIAFEGAGDLAHIEQIEPTDAILGGVMMDQSGDPFAEPSA